MLVAPSKSFEFKEWLRERLNMGLLNLSLLKSRYLQLICDKRHRKKKAMYVTNLRAV